MEKIACAICGSRRSRRVWARIVRDEYALRIPPVPNPSRWVACLRCGLVFQNPRPSEEQISALYADGIYREWNEVPQRFFDYSLVRPRPVLEWLMNRPEVQELARLEHPVALDIGCGVGGSLQLLRERGWEGFGVEPDPQLARAGTEYFNVPIAPEFMRDDLFPGQPFHMMISIHTFEHLLDPLDVARSAARRLAPTGGLLCVVVPTYVKANHWAWEWMNTAHTYMFSGPTLGNLLARAGFETLDWKYPSRRNHPDQEPSELWLLARATGVEKPASQLPFKEPLWHVQQQMLEVPPRALAAFIDHNSRRAGRFARKRLRKLFRPNSA